jgi:transposase-like protein
VVAKGAQQAAKDRRRLIAAQAPKQSTVPHHLTPEQRAQREADVVRLMALPGGSVSGTARGLGISRKLVQIIRAQARQREESAGGVAA